MASVFDDLLKLTHDLRERGWGAVLKPHGLDLEAIRSIDDLIAPLPNIDRSRPAFEDFCLEGRAALEPGKPARSLLYHALAHPGVHLERIEGKKAPDGAYATLEELELVENAIYALAGPSLGDLGELEVAVFAYQYRPGTRTPHDAHADMVFSRTGIARIGSDRAQWHGEQRSFRVEETADSKVRVRPARYAAFLARRTKVPQQSIMSGAADGDEERRFLVPVHKLFAGTECLPGRDLRVQWLEHHVNEKLRRAIEPGGLELGGNFDLDAAPFVRHSQDGADPLVELVPCGSSILVGPPAADFVRFALQRNADSGREEIVRFEVRWSLPWFLRRLSREFTTLHLISNLCAAARDQIAFFFTKREIHKSRRATPEFLNMRHLVCDDGLTFEDLNRLKSEEEFESAVNWGGYQAALFEDSLCDGCITAVISGMDEVEGRVQPAFSVLAPADFFPRVDQADLLKRFKEGSDLPWQDVFSHGTPEPLCRGRLSANRATPDPSASGALAFDQSELTMVAVISAETPDPEVKARPSARSRKGEGPVSWLPDSAAGHFAPGWEVTFDRDGERTWYHTYGLGSPFVEDLKLCSAGSGSWPAVAPDASRTFRRDDHPTSMPLLDRELGLHPRHPLVWKKGEPHARGWDGEYGPFFETIDGRYWVNYADMDRSDYVANSRKGWLRADLLSRLDIDHLVERVRALHRAIAKAGPGYDSVIKTNLWLVTAHAVEQWCNRTDRLSTKLEGPGFEFIFAVARGKGARTDDPGRLRVPVRGVVTCHVSRTVEEVTDGRPPF